MTHTRPFRRVTLGAVALAAVVILAGCGTNDATETATNGTGAETSGASGAETPEFTLQTLEGETFRLADHRGDVVVVEFLAPGCPSCAADLAALTKAAAEYPDATMLVADISGAGPDEMRDFYRRQYDVPPEVVIAPDRGFKVLETFGATALGDTVVIAPDGSVSWKGRWAGDESKLFAQIDQAARS